MRMEVPGLGKDQEGHGRVQSRYYLSICLEERRTATKNLESHGSCSCSAPRTVLELSENCDSTKGPTCRNYEIQQTLRMNISLLSSGSKDKLRKLRERRLVSCLVKKREPS
jgi:hypothetical protein